jgi:TM2 domain-containing membrane protein YozV
MHCPSCGTANPATTRFCGQCGEQLATSGLLVDTATERSGYAPVSPPIAPPGSFSLVPDSAGTLAAPASAGHAPAPPSGSGAAAPVINIVNQQSGGSGFNPALLSMQDKSPGVALLLSFLIVGAGQLYNGQIAKGILMFFGAIVLWFMLLGWIIHIWSWIDAYSVASRHRLHWQMALMSGGNGGGQVARIT